SESENSFFSYFTSSSSTLVKYMLCYESAMERQRHTQEKQDHQSFDSFPALLTPLPIEEHAAKVYTRNIFIRVQKEIVAGSWLCLITNQYILRRWTKDLIPPDLRNKKTHYGEKKEAIEKLTMEASIILDSCVHMLRENDPKLFVFVNKMKSIKSELETELPIVPTRTVSDFVQEFMGVKKPDKVKLRWPPRVTLGRFLPHAKGHGFKPRRGGFPSGSKKRWGLSPKAKVRVLHTAKLDVTSSLLHNQTSSSDDGLLHVVTISLQFLTSSYPSASDDSCHFRAASLFFIVLHSILHKAPYA
nr:FAR1 DNA binding domain, zinc finger, SWIM-type, MULE transposase domain, FHY3/FAR1 family [Tanacetum cinerariifolium]